ncbi:MAG: hypothetical protein J6R22_03080 [Alphaproteobacteria bacterium]|nr:hypothetical protein [Alphaproteobacteria bacterium]
MFIASEFYSMGGYISPALTEKKEEKAAELVVVPETALVPVVKSAQATICNGCTYSSIVGCVYPCGGCVALGKGCR